MSENLSFAEHLWDCYKNVVIRLENGRLGTMSIIKMIDNHIDLEKKIIKGLKFKLRTEKFGAMGNTMKQQLEYYKTLQNFHSEFANDLKTIRDELKEQNKILAKNMKNQAKQEKKTRGDFNSAKSKVESARKRDHADGKKWEDARKKVEELNAIGETAENKVVKCKKAEKKSQEQSDRSQEQYRVAVEKLRDVDATFYEDMRHILGELEKLDNRRLGDTKKALVQYADLSVNYADKIKGEAENLKKILDDVDPDQFIQEFIEKTQTGKEIPPPMPFEPYNDDGVLSKFDDSRSSPVVKPSKKTKKPKKEKKKPKKQDKKKSKKEDKKKDRGGGGSEKKKTVTVSADWDPEEDLAGEDDDPSQYLKLRAGDKIEVIEENKEGWWLGKLCGKSGYFPSTFIEQEEERIQPGLNPKPVQPGLNPKPKIMAPSEPDDEEDEGEMEIIGDCVVEHEYDAESESELTMKMGEVIHILVKNEDGWWFGKKKNGGETGYFPSNFTDIGRKERGDD